MASDFDLDCDIRVSTLSKYPDVFVMEEQDIDEEELWKELQRALRVPARCSYRPGSPKGNILGMI